MLFYMTFITGEIKLSAIQKNVRKIMREEFSLFSLGIGFDVDFDFLERIAMENRGIAQRIYANHDAAEQLRVRHLQEIPSLYINSCLYSFSQQQTQNEKKNLSILENRWNSEIKGRNKLFPFNLLPLLLPCRHFTARFPLLCWGESPFSSLRILCPKSLRTALINTSAAQSWWWLGRCCHLRATHWRASPLHLL